MDDECSSLLDEETCSNAGSVRPEAHDDSLSGCELPHVDPNERVAVFQCGGRGSDG